MSKVVVSEPSAQEHTGAGTRPHGHRQLSVHGCPVWPQWERMYLLLQRLEVLGWAGTQGGPPPSQR